MTNATEIFWLEQVAVNVPDSDEWLSAAERIRLAQLSFPKRRSDWRLGRWTAKRAVAAFFDLPLTSNELAHVEICPAASGAPRVFIRHEPAQIAMSLSHRNGLAACAVAECRALGCDLELIEPRSSAFIADYFTGGEQDFIISQPQARDARSALLWSAKESVLKALQTGLREDTRRVTVATEPLQDQFRQSTARPDAQHWHQFQARRLDRVFYGWWNAEESLVRTVVADPPALPPQRFEEPRSMQRLRVANLGQYAAIVYSQNR